MLIAGWACTRTPPGAWRDPAAIEAPESQAPASWMPASWVPAIVPGTLGASLRAAGLWRPDDDVSFDATDAWYRATITGEGSAVLRFDSLATVAEVYLDGALVLASDTMFVPGEVDVELRGTHALHVAFRSLDAHLAGRKARARWRPTLIRPPSLRLVRTLLLGHVPGWGPPVHAVGPVRPVSLLDAAVPRIVDKRVATSIDAEGDGLLDLAIRLSLPTEGWVVARVGGIDFALVDGGDGVLRGRAEIPDVERWWPHTHGTPTLYPLNVTVGGRDFDLGRVGFRALAVERDADGHGFGLVVNDVPVFCRGACWTTPDIVALPFGRDALLGPLTLARDAGMNMIRVCATMGYEGDAFYALCDELGLLVWQDFAFANFDYPASDPAFRASVAAEARHFLTRTQASPCLAVLCGASEVAQQAAMLGMPAALWSNVLFDAVLADAAAALRPDVPYVPHSPGGGELPFVADQGISHYYGVSAHRRPVEEARRAGVRFSAESLGFANVPDVAPVVLEPDRPAIVHPAFVERRPHDIAASWAFEAIRNHYTAALYDVDVAALRAEDPERFLDHARATSAEVMEATYAEWRRHGSPTRGALVWFLRDLAPGAGWGVLDALGAPKAAYWALKRAFRPVGLALGDENLNGLRVSLFNETATARPVRLTLACLREGATAVMDAAADLVLEPRSTVALPATTLWGGFFDTTYAYRFGEPSHDVTVARLCGADGGWIADAFHFPLGRGHARHDLGLGATLVAGDGGWSLEVAARRFAQSVRIAGEDARPDDNWFHLPPGAPRVIALGRSARRPRGTVSALNGRERVAW